MAPSTLLGIDKMTLTVPARTARTLFRVSDAILRFEEKRVFEIKKTGLPSYALRSKLEF